MEKVDYNLELETCQYIAELSKGLYTVEMAREMLPYFLKKYSYTQIKSHAADRELFNIFKTQKVIDNNYYNNLDKRSTERRQQIELRTQKERKTKEEIIRTLKEVGVIISGAVILGTISYGIFKMSKSLDNQMDSYLAMNNAQFGDENYNIVFANTTQKTTLAENDQFRPITIYDTAGMASDIVKLTSEQSEKFDEYLRTVYFDLSYDRLKNMDKIFNEIKRLIKDNTAYQNIYERIQNEDNFLEYLMGIGVITEEDKDYEDALNTIFNYKQIGDFNELDEKSQRIVNKMVDEYSKMDLTLVGLGVTGNRGK